MKKFVRKIFIFLGLFILSAVVILCVDYFFVGNRHLGNYQASILDKEKRFKSLESPKIVLIGNSNLVFGMDSGKLSEAMGMPVVNMAMHGGLGSAFNENLITLGDINEGDIVILAHHTYADNDTIEDPSLALITVEKHRNLWKLIRPKDIPGIIRAYPDYFKDCITRIVSGKDDNIAEDTTCYSRSAFNEYGDICRRFDDKFTFFPGSVTVPEVNDTCVNRINRLNDNIRSKGGVLLIAGYPIGSGEFTPDAKEYDAFEEELRKRVNCDVISHFTDYFIPYDLFYDTRYHLSEEGAELRTDLLIQDLNRWMEEHQTGNGRYER